MAPLNSPPALDTAPEADRNAGLSRALRLLIRLPLLVAHVLLAVPLALALGSPGPALDARGRPALDRRLVRWWSARLMRIFGIDVAVTGAPVGGPYLLVANHVSWIDIVLVHAAAPVDFVAKSEIASWPLVGWLAERSGTLFHRRGSTESLAGVLDRMLARIAQGRPVGLFPEGGAADGVDIKRFHARLFEAAVRAGVPVQPVALRYGDGAEDQRQVAFQPGEQFLGNFFRLLGSAPRRASIDFLKPITTLDVGRRQLAEQARSQIVAAVSGSSR